MQRLTVTADKLQNAIASGSNAAQLTADALKKMADKESDLKALQNAASALKTEIDNVTKTGGNATDQIKQLGTTTAAINSVEKQISQLGNTITSTARNQSDLNDNMSKLADVKDKISTIEKQMSGQISPSLRQAGDAVRKLYNELSNLPNGSAAFLAKKQQFDEANATFVKMQQQVKGVKESLHEAGEEGGIFGHIFKEAFAAITVEKGIEKALEVVTDFFKEAIKESLELEVTQTRLKNILNNFGKAEDLEKFNEKAEELSKKFGYLYAPEITKVQTQLVVLGKLNNEQINQLIPTIADFAAYTGKSMEESGQIVVKALEGSRRELHNLGIEVKQGSGFAENYGIVTQQLAQKVAGSAETFSKTGAGAIAAYNTQLKYLQEQLGNALLPSITSSARSATQFIQVLGTLPKFVNDNRQAIIALAGAYVIMNSAVIAETATTQFNTAAKIYNTVVERASTVAKTAGFIAVGLYQVAYAVLTGEIGLATAATAVFGTVTAAATGGLTLIIAAIAAIGTGLAVYAARATEAEKAEESLAKVRLNAEQSIQKEKAQLDLLVQTAKNEALSKEKRIAAIQKINELNPEMLNGITLENIATKEGTAILNEYIEALGRKAQKEALEQQLVEIYKLRNEALTKSQSDLVSGMDIMKQTLLGIITVGIHESDYDKIAAANKKELVNGYNAQIAAVLNLAKTLEGKEGKDSKKDDLKKLEEFYAKAAQYQKDFSALTLDSTTAEVNHVKSTYEELNNELAKYQSEGVITLQKYIEIKQQLSKNDAVKEFEDAQKRAEERAKKEAELRKKKEEQERKDLETFMQQLATLRNENGVLELDENAKAIAASREKFEKLYIFAKEHWGENGKITQELERYYADEVNRLGDKNTEKKYKDGYDNRVKLVTAMYDELRSKAEGDKAAVIAIDIAEFDAKAKIAHDYVTVVKGAKADEAKANDDAAKARVALEKQLQADLKAADSINDNTALLVAQINKDVEAETNAKLAALKHRYHEEQVLYKNNAAALEALAKKYAIDQQQIIESGTKATLQQATGYYNKFASTLNQVVSTIVAFQNQADEATLASAKKTTDDKNALYQDQLDKHQISQEEFNAKVAANNKQYSDQEKATKRKEFESNKQAQVVSAIATGITSVLNAYADGLETGGPAGPAVGAAFAALAGGFVGAQVALLESQPTPQFAKGGIANGPSHADGGIAMVDSRTGRKVGEMEGGEAYMILSKNTTRNNAGIISALLRSSMSGGGEPVSWAAAGALPKFNLGGIMDTMNVLKFANGGVFQAMNSQSTIPDPRYYELMNRMLTMAQQPPRAYIVYDDVATGATRVNNARARATFQS
jgi:hypothetical protein